MNINVKTLCVLLFIYLLYPTFLHSMIKKNFNHETQIQKKEKIAINLVNRAEKFFIDHDQDHACYNFVNNPDWRYGDIFIFVLDAQGAILCHGDDTDVLWKNINDVSKNITDKPVLQSIKYATNKGNWASFFWCKNYKLCYVKSIFKDGEEYIIGAGFFPESKEFFTKRLVKDTVNVFYEEGMDNTALLIQDSFGPLTRGDIYVYMDDFDGTVIADPVDVAFVGQTMPNDNIGHSFLDENLHIAESKKGTGWTDFIWKNLPSRAYIERVIDPLTKKHAYIASGYYPNITLADVHAFVLKAILHLKSSSSKIAFRDFSYAAGDFVRGPMTIFVCDFDGVCLADGEYPELVGQSILNRTDDDNKYYIKKIIKLADQYGKGVVTIATKNDYKTLYFESVVTQDGKFIIGSGIFSLSKSDMAKNLVNKGIDYLKTHTLAKTMQTFSNRNSAYYKGDMYLFVYSDAGILLVNGVHNNMIWKDLQSNAIIQEIIKIAKKEQNGWITYQARNSQRLVYIQTTEKMNSEKHVNKIIVGCGYFV